MNQKICIITGANSGIGKAAAIQIAENGHYVVMACRNKKKSEVALSEIKKRSHSDTVELMTVDMSLQSSIEQFAESFQLKFTHLDVLIHNAAYFDIRQKTVEFTRENVEKVWATNHIGPAILTHLLLKHLKKSKQGRIILISSKGLIVFPFLKINIEDPEFRKRKFTISKAYYQSKLAQVMYTYWLAEQLKETNVTVNAIRVTNVKIDTSRYPGVSSFMMALYKMKSFFSITPEEMAKTYTYLALSPEVKYTSGKYFDNPKKQVKSSKYSMQPENLKRVMKMTMRYVEIHD